MPILLICTYIVDRTNDYPPDGTVDSRVRHVKSNKTYVYNNSKFK